MKTVYQFKTIKSNNPFAPEFVYTILEGECFSVQQCSDIKQYLLEKESYLLKKLNNKQSFDGNTGLGNNSITSKFPYFNIFDFDHYMTSIIRSKLLELFSDVLNIHNSSWHSNLYVQSWFNVMRSGQKINFHTHGVNEDILYGFHITICTEDTKTIYHNPFDHRQIIEIENKPGYITLFPNFLPHQTSTYNGNDVRISIAGDLTDSSAVPKKEYGIYRELGFV